MDTVKSALKTPLLPNGILFEGSVLGCVPTMKFEDWDLVDNEKFPHLETSQLMKQSKEGVVTALQPRKWLHGVEEAGLLRYGFRTFTRHQSRYLSLGNCFV